MSRASPARSAASPSSSAPVIDCACRVGRCEQCLLCCRCGCDHDGIPVADKISRKRGRPPSPAQSAGQPSPGSLGRPPLPPRRTRSASPLGALNPRALSFESGPVEDGGDEEDKGDEGDLPAEKRALKKRKAFSEAIGVPGWTTHCISTSYSAFYSNLRHDQRSRLLRARGGGARG